MNTARVGCSGWNYDDWRGAFYPADAPRRRWLELYSQRFSTVEVNSTFYRRARSTAVQNWVKDTPEGFMFAVKASRYLTHVKRLTDLDRGFKRFFEPLAPLIEARRLGPVLWQLPETFRRDDDRLRHWLDALPDGMHTIEFRDHSWFAEPVLRLLRDRDVALTIGDHPKRPFQLYEGTASWRYVRFHYGTKGRRGNYSPAEIEMWTRRLTQWRRTGSVWAYFNNDWEAFAPHNAATLQQKIELT